MCLQIRQWQWRWAHLQKLAAFFTRVQMAHKPTKIDENIFHVDSVDSSCRLGQVRFSCNWQSLCPLLAIIILLHDVPENGWQELFYFLFSPFVCDKDACWKLSSFLSVRVVTRETSQKWSSSQVDGSELLDAWVQHDKAMWLCAFALCHFMNQGNPFPTFDQIISRWKMMVQFISNEPVLTSASLGNAGKVLQLSKCVHRIFSISACACVLLEQAAGFDPRRTAKKQQFLAMYKCWFCWNKMPGAVEVQSEPDEEAKAETLECNHFVVPFPFLFSSVGPEQPVVWLHTPGKEHHHWCCCVYACVCV